MVLTVNQAFFMSLFFFISAYLMPGSLERKGTKKYLADRLVRLGIPLLLVAVLTHPTLLYFVAIHAGNTGGASWGQYVWMCNTRYPNTAHLWFVLALLIYETAYAIYRSLTNGSLSQKIKTEFPSTGQLVGFIVVFGLIAFAIRTVYPIGKNFIGMQWGYFSLYTGMYAAGILARKKNWLSKLSYKQSVKWLLVVVLILPVIVYAHVLVSKNPEEVVTFTGGFTWQSLLLSIWEAITCLGLCFFLLAAFRKYGNRTSKFWQQTSTDSYLTYTLHSVVVVAFTILLEPLGVSPLPKFFIALVLSVVCSFSVSFLLRKIPRVKKVF
jgi:fucose 4-O-acetylase-like acetyltransferase